LLITTALLLSDDATPPLWPLSACFLSSRRRRRSCRSTAGTLRQRPAAGLYSYMYIHVCIITYNVTYLHTSGVYIYIHATPLHRAGCARPRYCCLGLACLNTAHIRNGVPGICRVFPSHNTAPIIEGRRCCPAQLLGLRSLNTAHAR
jgi:hypothetical protein